MAHQEKLRVLVIDDEVTQRLLVKEYLEEAGHVVRQSEDGKHGLKMAIKTKPDVILLDLLLPSIDGYSLCQSLKQAPETAETPVILITAAREPDVIERGFAAGADDFLTKPIDWPFLSDRIVNVVRKARERAQLTRLLQAQSGVVSELQASSSAPASNEAQLDAIMYSPDIAAEQSRVAVEAETARLISEHRQALHSAQEQLRREHSVEITALKSQHAEETRSLTERYELEVETIRAAEQQNLLVSERRNSSTLSSSTQPSPTPTSIRSGASARRRKRPRWRATSVSKRHGV